MSEYGESSYHRFLQGDQSALTELVQKYGNSLVRFAYCFLEDADESEDVMEDAFVALIVKRKKFDEEYKLKAYLFKVARNKCIDILRARKKFVPLEDNVEAVLNDDPESKVVLSEKHKQLYRAMQQLPPGYSEILNLVYLEGFSVPDTCMILHKNRKQVYNLLARAKASLKDILSKAGINYENL